jgi:D-alanyl-D-alanine carboxypeptidase
MQYFLIVLFAVSFFTSCEKLNDAVPSVPCSLDTLNVHPYAGRYQRIIDQLLEAGVPGVGMAVRSPEGTWVATGGKADLANNVDMANSQVLRIGSMSKIFTSATILLLQDEGILNIHDKVNKYVPASITRQIDNADEATIEELLNHKSGIHDYLGLSTILGILNQSIKKNSAEENLKLIYGKKADYAPGDGLLYSNSNYLLLALVIQHATGKSAFQAVNEKIIEPLHLQYTYATTDIPSNLVRGYYDTYDNGYMQDLTEIDNNAVGGQDMLDGGIISNAFDIITFFTALMSGQILTDESLAQMESFTEIVDTAQLGDMTFIKQYGLGLMKLETDHGTAIGHYGTVYCFNGLVLYFPGQGVTFSLLINGSSTEIGKVFNRKELFNYLFED